MSKILEMRCAASIEISDSPTAFDDFRFNERLGQLLLTRNGTACFNTGVKVLGRGGRMAWEGLKSHRWNKPQLQEIEKLFAVRDLRRTWEDAVRSDFGRMRCGLDFELDRELKRIFSRENDTATSLDFECKIGWDSLREVVQGGESIFDFYNEAAGSARIIIRTARRDVLTAAVACTPGWRSQYAVLEIERVSECLARLEPWVKGGASYSRIASALDDEGKSHDMQLYWQFSSAIAGWLGSHRHVADLENLSRMARISCALEICRIERGQYPSNLAELSPVFISSLPKDSFNDRPFRYNLDGEDRYRLESRVKPGEEEQGYFVRWPAPDDEDPWKGVADEMHPSSGCVVYDDY